MGAKPSVTATRRTRGIRPRDGAASPASDEPWVLIREAYRVWQRRRGDFARQLGLSLSEYAALSLCARSPSTPSEIAEEAGVTSAGATDIIDRLERRRLARRTAHPKDRRVVLVALTPAGERLCEKAETARRALVRIVARTMTEAQRTALVTGLGAFVRALPPGPT